MKGIFFNLTPVGGWGGQRIIPTLHVSYFARSIRFTYGYYCSTPVGVGKAMYHTNFTCFIRCAFHTFHVWLLLFNPCRDWEYNASYHTLHVFHTFHVWLLLFNPCRGWDGRISYFI